jgi:CRP-like cAMP-binding protein
MEKYLTCLRSLPLFQGMTDEQILHLLRCLRAREQHFEKNEIVWEPMNNMPLLCIIVQGGLMILQEDWRGNRTIMGDFGAGDFLGETALGAMDGVLPFFLSVRAKTTLILMDNGVAMNPCPQRCKAHLYLLRNMVDTLIQKEMRLLYKIEYLSRRTTREKLMAYLTIQSARAGSKRISVPYTRQELADILSVDRSAMCTELTRMQSDGLIRYDRRHFELLEEK